MRYLIYGAGSLGTVLGAYLTNAGLDVMLCNRNEAHVKALNENGAVITGKLNMNVKVKACIPSALKGKYDIIFLMTKQQNNPEVVKSLLDFMHNKSVIVVLQNGIPEEGVKEIAGDCRVLGGVVEWGAKLVSPGNVVFTSDLSANIIRLENNRKVDEKRILEVKEALETMCSVYLEDNMIGVRWSKLLINATFTGIGTSIGGLFGDVYRNRVARELAVRSVKECIDVAEGNGVTLEKVQGVDIKKIFYYTNPVKKEIAKFIMPIAMRKHKDTEPSMLQDIKKGKHSEIDYINGIVNEWGKKKNIPTPVNERIVEIVKMEERGEIGLSSENIKLYNEILK